MNEVFQRFVTESAHGKPADAAKALRITRSHVSRLLHGTRRITPELAERMEIVSHGLFRKEKILWPDQEKAA